MGVDDARNEAAWKVPAATSGDASLDLHGALDALPPPSGPPPDEWSAADQAVFQPALANVLNLATPVTGNPADPDPVVAPPIYGRYHAAITGVTVGTGGWVNELNLDPRLRSPAGLGARVVTAERDLLMASAWRQIATVELANRVLRHAQMVRAALQQTYLATFTTASSSTLLGLAYGVLNRVLVSTGTVASTAWGTIASSAVPWRAFFPAFRRLIRPFGPIWTVQGGAGGGLDGFVSGINDGSVTLVPPAGAGSGTATLPSSPISGNTGNGGGITGPGGPLSGILGPLPAWLQPLGLLLAILVLVAAILLDVLILLLGIAGHWVVLAIFLAISILILAILLAWWLLMGGGVAASSGGSPSSGGSGGSGGTSGFGSAGNKAAGYGATQSNPGGISLLQQALTANGLPNFQDVATGSQPPATASTTGADSAAATSFRDGLQGLLPTLENFGAPATSPAPSALDLDAVAGSVLSALDPTGTVVRRALSLVSVDARLQWQPADPIEPIMAAPVFPQPMYAPLRDISQEFLLPGVGEILRDSVGLLDPNMKFIEAYMVGLNFEMGRQLLWNGYPTDQRGSYFRQFWDVSGYVPRPTDPPLDLPALAEMLRDIAPIHTWPTDTDLGTHANPANPGASAGLVLLVRGELLRRYPTMHVYAVPAIRTAAADGTVSFSPSTDLTQEVNPLFRGTMSPDLSYFGFRITPAQARSSPTDPGYYFVLQQHPTQPRFGLETVLPGSPLWQSFPSNFATVAPQPGAPALPPKWGANSATMASITFRQPERIMILADLMLPGG